MFTKTVTYGLVFTDPEIIDLKKRRVLKFNIAEETRHHGKKIIQKYGVNSRVYDPRIKRGVSVVILGWLRTNQVRNRTYNNIEAIEVLVPNILMPKGQRSFRMGLYEIPKDAAEWDIIIKDKGQFGEDEEYGAAETPDEIDA